MSFTLHLALVVSDRQIGFVQRAEDQVRSEKKEKRKEEEKRRERKAFTESSSNKCLHQLSI